MDLSLYFPDAQYPPNCKEDDQHVWDHYVGRLSLEYTARCLLCHAVMRLDDKVFTKEEHGKKYTIDQQ